MLTHLYVRNLAVVEQAEVDFDHGLTVVTGETGAGKSLLVDALMLLSGTRADSSLVRTGAERAELSASFDLSGLPGARHCLELLEMDEDAACELRRVIRASGSSRAWINGRPATLRQLADLSQHLIEIHGQHEHQALLSREHQLQLLDHECGAANLLESVRDATNRWRELDTRIARLGGGEERAARLDLLRHEIAQLQQWVLPDDGLAELEARQQRLAHADRLLEGVQMCLELLDGEGEFSIQSALGRARTELADMTALDLQLAEPEELLGQAGIHVAEAVQALNHYASGLESDPEQLATVDAHLSELHALARRHRVDIAQLSSKQAQLQAELDELDDAGASIEELEAQRKAALEDYASAATRLSQLRLRGARRLGKKISALMQELGMQGGHFEVALQSTHDPQPDPRGKERCELMVSANPGQQLRPLRKVASGGELSRISLAIQVAALQPGERLSMVFDEVDSGIGGAVAEVVGQKLRQLAGDGQVLCVTHLPQVAAQAHAHLHVQKNTGEKSNTQTHVVALDDAARQAELARMLGGVHISAETRAHARQMLEQARSG